jgi:shikimate kinase
MNVFLIGYRGCGKTTVARHLAARLGWPWVDADEALETRAGKSIKQIFADDGEGAFRDLESAIVAELAEGDQQVVSLGGGAVLRAENRAALQGRGFVVWLQALPESLAARIAADATTAQRRPNLTSQGGIDEIRTLLDKRAPLYEEVADLTVDTDRLSPEGVAERIAADMQERKLV